MTPMRAGPLLAALLGAAALAGCGGDDPPASAGEGLYEQYACSSCHSLDGSRKTGPTFKGLAGSTVTLEGGEQVRATREYLTRSITEPDAQIVEGTAPGLMTASLRGFGLGDKPDEVRQLVDFIESVR